MAKVKQVFTLSKSLKNKLPLEERVTADKVLWAKSKGLCALCERPLGKNLELVTADHRIAGGKNTISNLYLAHKSCNSSRGNLEFNLAKPIVEFKVFCEEKGVVTFDDVIKNYVKNGNKQVRFKLNDKTLQLLLESQKIDYSVYNDPATKTDYFFAEIPIEYIHNDNEVQPRLITYSHVRKLALDFNERPVHEPSNCRLVYTDGDSVGELLQFDGQHKTTAQILLGRKKIQTKIYINPDIAMLQGLVVKIQQDIKKQPLTRSDTIAKLGDVISSLLSSYVTENGTPRSEKGFIEFQPKEKRTEIKKLYFTELARIIFFDEDNELTEWVKPGAKNPPTSDKVVIDKIIKPLIFQGLLEENMDTSSLRDNERRLIILILNTIARKMLTPDWNKESNKLQKIRTSNFFYQGSIGWWMNEVLIQTLRYVLLRIGDDKPLFTDPINKDQEGRLIEAVETLCDWSIWSTDKSSDLKAMRSNTIKNVKEVFKEYDYAKLVKEITQ